MLSHARFLLVAVFSLASALSGLGAQLAVADRPNVILVFVDNLGNGDIGCFGSKLHRTPHLDRMAREGTRFTSFYVASGVCTPSRAALMTGCYPRRVNLHVSGDNTAVLRPLDRKGLSPAEMTIAEVLKQGGYATGAFGKWHLGDQPPFLPTRQGFDTFFGIPYSDDMTKDHQPDKWPELPLLRNETVIEAPVDRDLLVKRCTEEVVEFLEQNQERPYFVYLPHTMPGSTSHPFSSAAFRGKSSNGAYGDAVEELDWSVGEILKALKDNDIENDTLVLFLSDNGPFLSYGAHAGSAGPFREGKLTAFEGGVRVPFLARWPGKVPAGRVCDELVTGLDLLPTVAKLVGAGLPKAKIDGADLSPLLLGEKGATGRASFAYFSGSDLHAVRRGKWKLHLPHEYLTVNGPPGKDGKPANHEKMKPDAIEESGIRGIASRHGYKVAKIELSLFDLAADPGESKNVAAAHPGSVKELTALADEFRRDLGDPLTGVKGNGLRAPGRDETAPKK